MDANTITTLIGSVGFPIVMSLLLFWFIAKTNKDTQTAIQNNTIAITELTAIIKEKGEKNND